MQRDEDDLRCPFFEFGCAFTGETKRDIEYHLDTECHYKPVRGALLSLKQQIAKLSEEKAQLQSTAQSMVASMQQQLDQLKAENKFLMEQLVAVKKQLQQQQQQQQQQGQPTAETTVTRPIPIQVANVISSSVLLSTSPEWKTPATIDEQQTEVKEGEEEDLGRKLDSVAKIPSSSSSSLETDIGGDGSSPEAEQGAVDVLDYITLLKQTQEYTKRRRCIKCHAEYREADNHDTICQYHPLFNMNGECVSCGEMRGISRGCKISRHTDGSTAPVNSSDYEQRLAPSTGALPSRRVSPQRGTMTSIDDDDDFHYHLMTPSGRRFTNINNKK